MVLRARQSWREVERKLSPRQATELSQRNVRCCLVLGYFE